MVAIKKIAFFACCAILCMALAVAVQAAEGNVGLTELGSNSSASTGGSSTMSLGSGEAPGQNSSNSSSANSTSSSSASSGIKSAYNKLMSYFG